MEEMSPMPKSAPERRKEFPTTTRGGQAPLIPKGLGVIQVAPETQKYLWAQVK